VIWIGFYKPTAAPLRLTFRGRDAPDREA
jgi:hypothetical protein